MCPAGSAELRWAGHIVNFREPRYVPLPMRWLRASGAVNIVKPLSGSRGRAANSGSAPRLTREAIMSQVIASAKHVRYVLGSLTAVLFAICVGNS